MNIVLTGLSGSGKTTLAREAAQRLGMAFVDLDDRMAAQAGMSIPDIFRRMGEPAFRELELQAAKTAARADRTLIATGGGAVTIPETISALRRSGYVIFLDRSPDLIATEIDCANRPLLTGGAARLHELHRQRRDTYLDTSDLVFPNNGPLEEALERLCGIAGSLLAERCYAVIGDPVAHSLSPAIHSAVFAELGLLFGYVPMHVPRGRIADFVERAHTLGLSGFNITAPHKQAILSFLHHTEEPAALCGAVNTVVRRDGRLYGHNTDMDGLLLALRGRGREYGGSRIAVLGTGGAAAGVALKAAMEGAGQVVLLGRSQPAAGEIRQRVGSAYPATRIAVGDLSPSSLESAVRTADILINTIPDPETGATGTPLPTGFLKSARPELLVCDLTYHPPRTRLLQKAEQLGLALLNGLDMLIYQAILADELFLGTNLDCGSMYSAVTNQLKPYEKGTAK